jgi:hypothetical protein
VIISYYSLVGLNKIVLWIIIVPPYITIFQLIKTFNINTRTFNLSVNEAIFSLLNDFTWIIFNLRCHRLMSRKLFEFHEICFIGKSSNRQRDNIPELQIIWLKCSSDTLTIERLESHLLLSAIGFQKKPFFVNFGTFRFWWIRGHKTIDERYKRTLQWRRDNIPELQIIWLKCCCFLYHISLFLIRKKMNKQIQKFRSLRYHIKGYS